MLKRVHFEPSILPYLLVAPQVLITILFFLWPAGQALYQSVLLEDPWSGHSEFVWFENFLILFADDLYLKSFLRTVIFSGAVATLAIVVALILAGFADRIVKATTFYRTLLIWPYAIAPVVAGALFVFMFDPTLGVLTYFLELFGVGWNHKINSTQAMVLVILAAAWKQIPYNFLFFLAAMQSVPKFVIEAATIDGAGPGKRFWTIIFPLISPTTFFLFVINVVYAFFDTFGIIHALTDGGPANSTTTLVFKVFKDGFIGLDLGGAAAQSVILMGFVIALTVMQFRFIERRVEY